DADLRAFYGRLLRALADSGLRDGDWRLCDVSGWPDNDSFRRLVAWGWPHELIVLNLSDAPPPARVHLPRDGPGRRRRTLTGAPTARATSSKATASTWSWRRGRPTSWRSAEIRQRRGRRRGASRARAARRRPHGRSPGPPPAASRSPCRTRTTRRRLARRGAR